jgi:hypothetical protein
MYQRPSAERICKHCGKTFSAPLYQIKNGYGIYCSRRCTGYGQVPPIEERLAAKTRIRGECWEWTGPYDRRGYGLCKLDGKMYRVHRLVYERHNGPVPAGHFVMHSCDNPSCVNPSHLSSGTPKANVHDMVAKGRHVHGERHPRTVFTASDIQAIRETYQNKQCSQQELANRYGVTQHCISAIIRRDTWKHI